MTKKKNSIVSNEQIQNKLKELGIEIQVGDCFLENDGNYIKITGITDDCISYDTLNINGEVRFSSTSSFKNWEEYHFKRNIKVDKSYRELLQNTFDRILNEDLEDKEPEISTSTAMIEQDTKKNLINMKNLMEERRKNFEIMERILHKKREELSNLVHSLNEKIKKVMKVLCQIELYLGINEDIIQLQQGVKADAKDLIYFRQQILYMDEEYGAVENDGLDFEKINEFDEWIIKDKHYERLVPEKKCVVVLRVRRHPKDYHTQDPLTEAQLNYANFMTYVLIRNGDNIYRIYANIVIKPRLFPLKDEIQKMYDDVRKDSDGQPVWSSDKDKFEEQIFTYQQNLLLLQGLIDRTPIFQPLTHTINLFLPDTHEGVLQLIYDDEISLTEGRQYYKEWHKELNSKIKRGTRIYFCGFDYYTRYDKDGNHRLQYPRIYKNPDPGVYSVKRLEECKHLYSSTDEYFVCHYNPKDDIYYRGWTRCEDHERAKSIYFLLHRDDSFVLNYDLIDLDTIEYYINSRIDREDYLNMLPVLYQIKKMRLEEIAWEKGFVKSMALELECDEKIIWDAINWWKNKVIWKRPIRKDDSKAWRMIKKRLIRQIRG